MIDQPPAQYLPYDGPVIELVLPMQRVKTICYVLGVRGPDVRGCAGYYPGGCLVVVPRVEHNITAADQADIRQHELAHCNGWRH